MGSSTAALPTRGRKREKDLGKFLKTDAISSERITGRDLSLSLFPRWLKQLWNFSSRLPKLQGLHVYLLFLLSVYPPSFNFIPSFIFTQFVSPL